MGSLFTLLAVAYILGSGGHLQQEAGAESPHGGALGVHGQQEAAVGDVQ